MAATYYSPLSGTSYNLGDVFGSKVAPVSMPNPASDLAQQFPGLSTANSGLSKVINTELSGQLSPETLDMIKNTGAAWGVQSGMPGSGLAQNNALRNVGLTTEQLQRQGVQDYNSTIPTVSGTQTVSPDLQAQIGFQNNVSAASPNPASAGSYAQDLFQQYLKNLDGTGTPVKKQVTPMYMQFQGNNYSNWI